MDAEENQRLIAMFVVIRFFMLGSVINTGVLVSYENLEFLKIYSLSYSLDRIQSTTDDNYELMKGINIIPAVQLT